MTDVNMPSSDTSTEPVNPESVTSTTPTETDTPSSTEPETDAAGK